MRRTCIAGFALIGLTFGGFGTWAATAPLDGAVIANGTVKVISNRKEIQHEAGGIIETILVKDGMQVEAGAELIKLDRTRAENSFELLSNRFAYTKISLLRLQAEMTGNRTFTLPDPIPEMIKNADYENIYKHQKALLDARIETLNANENILRERIAQLEQDINGTTALVVARAQQQQSIEWELEDLRPLLEKGLTPRTRISALERDLADIRGQISGLKADIASNRRSIAEAEEEIGKARSAFLERAHEHYQSLQSQMHDIIEQTQTARHELEQTILRAPNSGKIVNLAVFTAGGVIRPGDVLMEIVPDDDQLIIEARIRPQDADIVTVGQIVGLQFHTHAAKQIERMEGQLTYISADSLVDERNGEAYFTARIALTSDQNHNFDDVGIKPGVGADVFIQTGARTALAYLTEPLQQSIRKAWREK